MKSFKTILALVLLPQFETAFSAERCEAGFRDFNDYQSKVDDNAADFQKTYKMITDEKILFAVHAPENFRKKISVEGLRTAVDTGNTYLQDRAEESIRMRNGIEANMSQTSADEYASWISTKNQNTDCYVLRSRGSA